MGSSNSIFIELANPGRPVFPGGVIEGRVHINAPEGIKLGSKGITLKLKGTEGAKWTEQHTSGSGKNRSTRTVHRRVQRTIIRSPPERIDNFQSTQNVIHGQFSFPFSVQLPHGDFPPTFMCPYRNGRAWVSYYVSAKVNRKGTFSRDMRKKVEVFVAPPLPNQVARVMTSYSHEQESMVSPCCGSSGPCTVIAEVPRRLITGSDTLQVCLKMLNDSPAEMDGWKVKLKRVLYVRSNKTETRMVASSKDTCKFLPNTSTEDRNLDLTMDIPQTQCSFDSQILQCNYYLAITIPTPCGSSDIKLKFDIHVVPAGFTLPQLVPQYSPEWEPSEMKEAAAPPRYEASAPPEYKMPAPPVYTDGTLGDQTEGCPSAPPPGWNPQVQPPLYFEAVSVHDDWEVNK
eukprot:79619_1